jgi:hypothetical protein
MMKLTKTGIGLLTRLYRSVLKKCFLINAGLFFALAPSAAEAVDIGSYAYSDATISGQSAGWQDTYHDPNLYYTQTASKNLLVAAHYITVKNQTISASNTIIQNLEALDLFIGSYTNASSIQTVNKDFLTEQRKNNTITNTVDYGGSLATNLEMLDYVVGALQNGNHISHMASMGDNIKTLDTAIGAKQTGTYITGANVYANLKALDTQVTANTSTLSAHTAVIDALDNNYYMNYRDSMAKSFIKAANDNHKNVIVRSAKHDVTIFGRQSDNTATTTQQAA